MVDSLVALLQHCFVQCSLMGQEPERIFQLLREHLDALAPTLIQGDNEAELEFLLEQVDLSADQLDTLLTCAQRLDHPRFTSRILAMTQPKASTSWADKSFDL